MYNTRQAVEDNIKAQYNSSYQNLQTFCHDTLSNFIVQKQDNNCNVYDLTNGQNYALDPLSLKTLYMYINKCRYEGIIMRYLERQSYGNVIYSGLMIDLDIQQKSKDITIGPEQYNTLIHVFIQQIKNDIHLDKSSNLRIFFTCKTKPTSVNKHYRYGIHVLIPHFKVTRGYKKYLLSKLSSNETLMNSFAGAGVINVDDFVDTNSAAVPVFLFGSCKYNGKPYIIDKIYDIKHLDTTMPMIQEFTINDTYNLVEEMSLINPENKKTYEYKSNLYGEIKDISSKLQANLLQMEEIQRIYDDTSLLSIHNPKANYLMQILSLLPTDYSSDYTKWRNVIFAIAHESASFKPIAIWFSQNCSSKWVVSDENCLDKIWTTGVNNRVGSQYTIRSLMYWAKRANPDKYIEACRNNYVTQLMSYTYKYQGKIQDGMLGDILFHMFKHKFKVVMNKIARGKYTYDWFEFMTPEDNTLPGEVWKWRAQDKPISLFLYMRSLEPIYDDVITTIKKHITDAENEQEAKHYKLILKQFSISKSNLFFVAYQKRVIEQCQMLFSEDRKFQIDLNTNPNILGVGNGVLQLRPTIKLIDHCHEYPISNFTTVNYIPFNPKSQYVRLVMKLFQDVILEPDAREKILCFVASSLTGEIKDNGLLQFIGGGSNGKSSILRFITAVLGEHYSGKFPASLLVSDHEAADRTNSAFVSLDKKRFAYYEETRIGAVLNDARLKELVDTGKASGRDLYEGQRLIDIVANHLLASQHELRVTTSDHGTWRRYMHYKSKVKFCFSPDPTNPFEKKADVKYRDVYPHDGDFLAAFLSILVFYYDKLQRVYDGNIKNIYSPTIDKETHIFRLSQDMFHKFITEQIVLSEYNSERYTLQQIALKYMEWYSINIDRKEKLTVSEITKQIELSELRSNIEVGHILILQGCRILAIGDKIIDDETPFIQSTYNNTTDCKQFQENDEWWNRTFLHSKCSVTTAVSVARPLCKVDDDQIYHEKEFEKSFDISKIRIKL